MNRKQPEFKRHFYLNWFVQDWLGDPNLKLCPAEVKGFWIDLLMQMVLSFPFGHLSRLSKPLMRESKSPLVKKILVGSLVHQNPDQNPNQSANQNTWQEDDQWVRLSLGLNLHEQLSLVVNLEDKVPHLTGYSVDEVKKWIDILDDLNVFSRTENGIIYNRRMVRDFQKRKQAFINGCKGNNPYEFKSLKQSKLQSLVHQNNNQISNIQVAQNNDQQHHQNINDPVNKLVHQMPSNSNSNSNSNYIINNTVVDKGNLIVKEEEKKEINNISGGQSGVGNSENKPPKIDFSGLKNFKDQILRDQSFIEPFLMAAPSKIKDDIPDWLDLFNLHCVTSKKLEKDYHDYMSHFSNWIWKNDLSKKPPSHKQIKEVAKNQQQSKDLLSKYSK